jgi:3-isopropylmalate/(R)-2-methylmalate dehydratase small subunit
MEKFTTHSGTSAPLDLQNVDTDMVIPADYLKTIKRTGLGEGLFNRLRFKEDGAPVANFFMNQEQFDGATVLVTRDNFGCGSSREHAPWALLDYGIKVILAPSFADIFYNNCFKNGILPIKLPAAQVDELIKDANQASRIEVNLETKTITRSNGEVIAFELEDFRRHNLLNGLDDIGITLESAAQIDTFEGDDASTRPWLTPAEAA